MVSGIVTLLTSFLIAGIAAYFSIAGLMAIFSGASLAVAVMAGSLELGKLVTASWLYRNWKETSWLLKSYLTVAVAVLMFITSLGIFGYLSKAHSDQSIVSGGASEQVALFDEKIKYQREIIDTNQKVIAQMDDVVNQTLSRTTDAKGAERALQVRRSQSRDRQRLVAEISTAQKEIEKLNEQRAPVAVELKKVESEVGPIKYVAALIYGDNPETNLMERAVRWMIILLVAVFDPLAVALLIAANQTLSRHKTKSTPEDDTHGNKSSEPLNDSTNTTDTSGAVELTAQSQGGTLDEGNNIQNNERAPDSSDGILLQLPGASSDEPEVDNRPASVEEKTEDQKKRSSNSKSKSVSSKKKINPNQKRSSKKS
jgi:hypothetical protein